MAGGAARRRVPVGLAVAVGGGLGAVLRFAVSGGVAAWAGASWPWGTFAVNLLGSLALGAFSGVLVGRGDSPALRGFLLTGLCGGFTTFAAFEHEVLAMLERGAFGAAAAHALSSAAACVAGVWAGAAIVRASRRRPA